MTSSVAVAVAAAKTSTGNQDITTTDLGGQTPKAVLFLYSRGASNAVVSPHMAGSFGAADASSQWTCTSYNPDGATAWLLKQGQVGKTDKCLMALYQSGGTATNPIVHSEAAFVSFIANGVRINWTTASADGWLITALFFAGSDWDVKAGTTLADGSTVTTGWQPDAIINAGVADAMNGTITVASRYKYSYGFTAWPGGNKFGYHARGWHFPITRQCFCQVQGGFNFPPGAMFDTFTGGIYDLTTVRSATGFTQSGYATDRWGYLALKYNGSGRIGIGGMSFSAATGAQPTAGFGGKPSKMLIVLAHDNGLITGGGASMIGQYFFSETRGGGWSMNSTGNDGSTVSPSFPTLCKTITGQNAVNMYDVNNSVPTTQASFTSFDNDGVTFTFSSAPSGTSDWAYLTLLDVVDAGGGSLARNQGWIID